VEARHVEEADDEAGELLEVFLAAELGVEQHHKVAGVGLGRTGLHDSLDHAPDACLHSTKAGDHLLLEAVFKDGVQGGAELVQENTSACRGSRVGRSGLVLVKKQPLHSCVQGDKKPSLVCEIKVDRMLG